MRKEKNKKERRKQGINKKENENEGRNEQK
jgi:hypothetical protein